MLFSIIEKIFPQRLKESGRNERLTSKWNSGDLSVHPQCSPREDRENAARHLKLITNLAGTLAPVSLYNLAKL
jgi:hypothetical protein